MSADIFIDTNVFIYHLDSTDKRKQAVAERIVREGLVSGTACISFQVVQECLNTILRKARLALEPEQARMYLDSVLVPLLQVSSSPRSTIGRWTSRPDIGSASTTRQSWLRHWQPAVAN